jgi:hypothetical protein
MTKIIDLKINSNIDGVANAYRPIISLSIATMKEVLESQEFKNSLFEAIYDSNNLEGELSNWKKAVPLIIYEAYLQLDNLNKGLINLELCTYYNRWTSAMGEGAEGNKIKLNIKFLTTALNDRVAIKTIGSLIAHELGHKQPGFEHDFRNTKRRKNSICYLINKAFEEAYKQLYGVTESPKPVYKVPWYKRIWDKIFSN